MAQNKISTIFNQLENSLFSGFDKNKTNTINSYQVQNKELYRGKNKEEYNTKKLQAQQQKLLAQQWKNSGRQVSQTSGIVETNRLMMYRDANLMDNYPHIGSALDIYAEESCTLNDKGKVINIYSESDRIRSVLEDLFVNRLDIHVNLPMWVRNTCKYGDTFLLLNISDTEGVIDSRQLPVDQIERIENDFLNPYNNLSENNDDEAVKFIWRNVNAQVAFKSWQIAHFRLLNDSIFLPYGVSILSKARRHWRLLTMMEDLLLIYRLERSIERRVYKIYVGNIDDADIPSYIDDIANNFKRTQIIDPHTGQIDLNKNILGVDQDIFIPTRTENASTPIDTLPSSTGMSTTEDLKFFEDKLISSLRVPKTFLGFDDAVGDGKNLAMMDVRFERSVNRIQQCMLMELNKIALIHLYLLGFEDELSNFTITLNNPSRQAELLRLDELQKKAQIFRDAVSDPGNGIPMMSYTKACRDILKLSDFDIIKNLEEIRLEKAIAAELEMTNQIIKRTGYFDSVDRLYGEPGAEYQQAPEGGGGADFGGGGFGGGDLGGGGFGDSDFEMEGGDLGGEIEGAAGEVSPSTEAGEMGGGAAEGGEETTPTVESKKTKKPLLTESKKPKYNKQKRPSDVYINSLKQNKEKTHKIIEESKMHDLNNFISLLTNITDN